jgi:hypothetical protein
MQTVLTSEASADTLSDLVDKALGYPRKGAHQGGGRHVTMPDTWTGTGLAPPGWTRSHESVFRASAADAAYPIDNATAALVAASTLPASEKATVASAVAARVDVDPSNNGLRTPKATPTRAVAVAAVALEEVES